MKIVVALVTLFIISIAGIAQAPKEKSLLWQVSGNGISTPSYLFGTIHLMCPEDFIMPEKVKTAFNKTNKLFLEIDMDDAGMLQQVMTNMMMANSNSLEKIYGEERFTMLDSLFKKQTGMSLQLLQTTKPILLVAFLYPSLLKCQPESWENKFTAMAHERKMELKGLEKVDDQMKAIESIPDKEQAEMLAKTLTNPDSTKASFEQLLQVYKSKDIASLYELSKESEGFGDYEEALITERNARWLPVISAQVKTTPTFFAFGAGHLGGENGVIALLRKKGFTVKPVMY